MSAVISPCGLYRYRLERHGLSGAGGVAWIMVNPSTADATQDDATIRKVIGFTEREAEAFDRQVGGWARPLDLGGFDTSHHSATASALAKKGLLDRFDRGSLMGARAVWLYRITDLGRQALNPSSGGERE
jgi:hypothetical protein